MPASVKEAAIKGLNVSAIYPDPACRQLKAAILTFLHKNYQADLTQQEIVCGNGAVDLIYRLVAAYKPKHALLCAPTFGEYEKALKLLSCQMSYYFCPENTLEVGEEILQKIDAHTDLLFLCNPNNPTGLLLDPDLLWRIIQKTKETGTLLVIDECFLDFVEDEILYSTIPILSQNKHILVLKSFTKMYAMPGLRLGYALCADTHLIQKMEESGPSWSVSTVASYAGMAALKLEDYPQKVRDYISRERDFLMDAFRQRGIHFSDSCANFILLKVDPSMDLYHELLSKGMLIRTCEDFKNLGPGFYRIAVHTHENNRRLVEALSSVIVDGKGLGLR